jgi:predicted NAD/FAD-dependent oxidoreductase
MPKYCVSSVSSVNQFWKNGQGDQSIYFCGDYMNHHSTEGAALSGKLVAAQIKSDLEC